MMISKPLASLSSGLLARKGAAKPAMRPQVFGLYEASPEKLEDLGWNDMGHEGQRPALAPVRVVDEEQFEPQLSRTPLAGLTPASPVHHQQAEIEERFNSSGEDERFDEEACHAAEPETHVGDLQVGEWRGEGVDDQDTLELADCLPEATPAVSAVPVETDVVVPLHLVPVEPAAEAVVALPAAPRRSKQTRAAPSAKEKAAFTLRLDPNRHLKLRLACAVNAKSAQQLVTKALDELLSSMPELDAMASKAPERANRKG